MSQAGGRNANILLRILDYYDVVYALVDNNQGFQ